jgi:hypothetical protein
VAAVVAGLVASVKLARVESKEIQNRSPRVRSIISESIAIARMVSRLAKRSHDWKQVRAGGARLVDDVDLRRADLELTEYKNEARYRRP